MLVCHTMARMSSSAPSSDDDVFDEFLSDHGHETEIVGWERSYNKLQCPDCGALHEEGTARCSVCDWRPS
ncbi:hypothetical protein GCM10009060_17740 [Halorubrum trapanicum]